MSYFLNQLKPLSSLSSTEQPMPSWFVKLSPCEAANTGPGYDQAYALYEFLNRGTNGCPCCTFFRGVAVGAGLIWLLGKLV